MRALRKDANQEEIVRALRAAGVRVFVLHVPCDLLCRRGDLLVLFDLYLLDVDGVSRYRKRDPKQLETFAQFGVRLVKTPEAALTAVGLRVEV
jgi:tRNA-dihydrouridine synthase